VKAAAAALSGENLAKRKKREWRISKPRNGEWLNAMKAYQ